MESGGKIAVSLFLGLSVVSFALLAGFGVIKLGPTQSTVPTGTVITTTPAGTTTTTVTPALWPTVTSGLEIQVVDRDALASSAITEGTNIQTDYWTSTNGATFSPLGPAGTSSPYKADFNVNPTMNGIVYFRTQIVSGQNYYISPTWISVSNNPCIQAFDFMDITNSGTPQWIFQCNLAKSGTSPAPNSNAAGGGAQIPLLIYYAMAYNYAAPTANSNSASTGSASTSANALNQILYYLTPTTAKAFAISQFEVKVNSTNNALWNLGQSVMLWPTESTTATISTTSLSLSSAQGAYNDGTYWHYPYYFNAPSDSTFGVAGTNNVNNFKGAYFYFATNSGVPAQIPFTFNLYTNLASTTHLDWTATWTYMTPAQGTATVSKTIAISADGSST
jgi:hypothetical protein